MNEQTRVCPSVPQTKQLTMCAFREAQYSSFSSHVNFRFFVNSERSLLNLYSHYFVCRKVERNSVFVRKQGSLSPGKPHCSLLYSRNFPRFVLRVWRRVWCVTYISRKHPAPNESFCLRSKLSGHPNHHPFEYDITQMNHSRAALTKRPFSAESHRLLFNSSLGHNVRHNTLFAGIQWIG